MSEALTQATMWINLKNKIITEERSQTQKYN